MKEKVCVCVCVNNSKEGGGGGGEEGERYGTDWGCSCVGREGRDYV